MNIQQMEPIFARHAVGGTAFNTVRLAAPLPEETITDDSTFALVDEMLKRAISDVTQAHDLRLRWEALAWLWVCCPDVADQLRLTYPESTAVHQQATAYMDRYAAF